ncbi:hypothetical protein MA16_Dca020181 [Dendrobium catenatum]|uniref:Reverse transcriptase domain-containing protein n=1 Tax=Dendrobium catenatum TaxID=906689 RepID=A0A2I0WH44_9ASPA|nr:hypothetical protein MA16_Dca020181 [Dendrobium catenatum]
MPFSMCNAPATFQTYMMSIFSNLIEQGIKIFFGDFNIFGTTFDSSLDHLTNVLKMCGNKFSIKLGKVSIYGNKRDYSWGKNFKDRDRGG